MRRATLFATFTVAGVAIALLLGGCAPAPVRITGSGIEAPAPQGYLDWCPEDPAEPMRPPPKATK